MTQDVTIVAIRKLRKPLNISLKKVQNSALRGSKRWYEWISYISTEGIGNHQSAWITVKQIIFFFQKMYQAKGWKSKKEICHQPGNGGTEKEN